MFSPGSSHRPRDPQEERDIYDWALRMDRQLDAAFAQGHLAQLMPGAPPGHLKTLGAASPQSAKVQVQAVGEIPSKLLHLTTQTSGYISPLAKLSPVNRVDVTHSYQAAKDICAMAESGPLCWADKSTVEKILQGGVTPHPKPEASLNLPFMEKKTEFHKFRNICTLDGLVTASLKGYVPHPNASKDLNHLFAKTTVIAAGSYAPGTKNQYKRAWNRFANFCSTYYIDPLAATGPEVAAWLVQRSEDTKSAGMVQGDLQAVRCFRRNAGFPMDRIPIVTAVMSGLKKVLDTEELNRIGFEPEMI